MNILPKKNWHVRTRKNIEKVRKDEAKAAEEERKLNERIALAEREARTRYLRNRAQTGPSTSSTRSEVNHSSTHVDLFADSQLGRGDQRVNLEHEREEKQKTEKWEQQVGILTYLHKSQSDVDHPWYLQPHDQRLLGSTDHNSVTGSSKDEERKDYLDPLKIMKQHLSKMKSTEKKPDREVKGRKSGIDRNGEKRKPEKVVKVEPGGKMAQLRKERLDRERKERERAEKLIRNHRRANGSPVPSSVASTPRAVDERRIQYHSQFFPHLSNHKNR